MEKKERIIYEAKQLFLEKGIEKTTVKDITDKVGIAPGTFYLYFPTKLAVMPAIAEEIVSNINHTVKLNIKKNYSLNDLVNELINSIFENTKVYEDLTLLVYSGFTQTKEIKNWELIYEPLYNWLQQGLEELQMNGEISNSINTAQAARITIGSIESAAEQVYLFDEEKKEEDIESYKSSLSKFIYGALSKGN